MVPTQSIVICIICTLLMGFQIPLSLAATVTPTTDPVIQTLDRSGIGPQFVPVKPIDTLPNGKNAAPANVKEDAQYWQSGALLQLVKTIKRAKNLDETSYKRKAKNIIIFIGDGMGVTTITAGRIYKGQHLQRNNGEEEILSFDEFPYTGLAKTYNVDKQVPDSAGTATALFTGSKTDYGAIGMDSTRSKTNATQGRLSSIMDWAQAAGKRTGIVTTTRITHATPAATYAKIYHRDWECDTEVPAESVGRHVDIARQLVENAPGRNFHVIMGGGLKPMGAINRSETSTVNFEGATEKICERGDQRNLVQDWLRQTDSSAANGSRVFVHNREQLLGVDVKSVDRVMGLFRNNHITYSIARQDGEPSLEEMTRAAIGVLERGTSSQGYVLMVEGGRIDQGHHQNYARAAMQEVLELDMAVEAALRMTDAKDTLILVTADHSHAVTLNGYPERGADILGFANKTTDPAIYETLTYANGPGYWDHLSNGTANATNMWIPLDQWTAAQREQPTYRHMAMIARKDETHGGEDVAVFASGPGASLVRGVFEQNYLAYVMSYAGCMGPARLVDDSCEGGRSSASMLSAAPLLVPIVALLLRAVLADCCS